MRLIITIGLFVLAIITTCSYYNLSRREKESQKRQRKTLRGQAIAGDLEGAQKGLQTILDRRENNG